MSRRETHNAVVTRNLDDDFPGASLKGAIFFNAPTLFEGEYPVPAFPCFHFASLGSAGIFFVPKVGDEIEIEISVDDGTDDTSDVELDEPRWKCMIYDDELDIHDLFKENYPFRMGWVSNKGHHLIFDDKKGSEKLILGTEQGHRITFDDVAETILFESISGTKYEIRKDGTLDVAVMKDLITAISGDYIVTIIGEESVTTTGDRTHTAANHNIFSSGDIKLGSAGASENLVLGQVFKTFFNVHAHIGNLGILTGVPIVAMSATELASKHFTEL